jgi:dUTP pyrophosphatase
MKNNPPVVKFRRLHPDKDGDIPLPRYMTPGAAGMDIHVAVDETVSLPPGAIALLPTGFAMAMPPGYEAQIRPRSGLAVKHGIGLINSPGTIDADYRGEVKIAVINWGPREFRVQRGDRVAQMVINPVCRAEIELVDALEDTSRNTGGFGHTGK